MGVKRSETGCQRRGWWLWLALLVATVWARPALAQADATPPGETAAPAQAVVDVARAARLTVTDVDDTRFPQMQAYVAVVDNNGVPVTDFAAEHFLIVEDDRTPITATLAVSSALGALAQGLDLMLVIDRSTDAGNWAALQVVGAALLDNLGAADRVGIVVYGDDAELVQALTLDKEAARVALLAVTPGGTFSALNLAMRAGLASFDAAANRRALIVLADHLDNTAAGGLPLGPPPLEIVNAAQAGKVALHFFGYGPQIAPVEVTESLLGAIPAETAIFANAAANARTTGGRTVFVARAADLGAQIPISLVYLRTGYGLAYTSGLQADGATHLLEIGLQRSELGDLAAFVARRTPITVTITNLVDGQQVSGDVLTNIQVTATTPISTVTFFLDAATVITTVDTVVGGVVWDSLPGGPFVTAPGPHTFGVQVADTVGNWGSAQVTLDVVMPLALAMELPPAPVAITDTATITLELATFFGNAQMDVLVGDRWIGSVRNPPANYPLNIAASAFVSGVYTVTVRVIDGRGYALLDDRHTIQFVDGAAPPAAGWLTSEAASTDWAAVLRTTFAAARPLAAFWDGLAGMVAGMQIAPSVWWWGAALLAILVLLAVLGVWWRLRRRRPKSPPPPAPAPVIPYSAGCVLEFTNQGNVATRYLLRGEDPSKRVGIRFVVDGVVLMPPAPVGGAVLAPSAPVAASNATTPAPAPVTNSPSGASGGAASMAQSVGAMATQASGVADTAGNLLTAMGQLAPGALGASFRSGAAAIRQEQAVVTQAQAQVNRTERAMTDVSKNAQALAGATGSATAPAAAPPPANRTPAPVNNGSANAGSISVGSVNTGPAAPPVVAATPTTAWCESPLVAPGAVLRIDVQVTALASTQSGATTTLRILHRPSDAPETDAQQSEAAIVAPVVGKARRKKRGGA